MKLSSSFLLATTTAQKYKDLRVSVRNGSDESNRVLGNDDGRTALACTIPEATGNVDGYYCNSKFCTLMCKPGSIPDGRARNKCINGAWKDDFPNCITCENSVDDEPSAEDSNLGFLCSVDDPTDDRRCAMTCSNGGDLLPTAISNTVDLICNCHKKKGCEWREDGSKKAADLSSYSCSIPPTSHPTDPEVPDGCPADKPSECTSITSTNISFQNSWTCRNCFRIRASYSLADLNWSDLDFLVMRFDVRVAWISWGHPIDTVESLDNEDGFKYKINFKKNANFMSGELTHYSSLSDISNGACGLHMSASTKATTHFLALDADTDYNGSRNCGRCVKLKCECSQSEFTGACATGSDVIAMVVDMCPDAQCLQGHLDLSPGTWNDVTGSEDPSKYDGSWEFVECPSEFLSDSVAVSQLYLKTGSGQYWSAAQPTNTRFGINFMSVNGIEIPLHNSVGDNFYFNIGPRTDAEFPLTLLARNTEGEVATLVISSPGDIVAESYLNFDSLL
ncbi:unnamed protein product [Oikopleura dioica]|uniref:Expansin-like EG45 domain-containing protein n=1 Tax=Oikopleura dioica TaxID=34765 RepID=E4X7V0_OIKDI|nr:unnamed protein product [Oikopleura dioica]